MYRAPLKQPEYGHSKGLDESCTDVTCFVLSDFLAVVTSQPGLGQRYLCVLRGRIIREELVTGLLVVFIHSSTGSALAGKLVYAIDILAIFGGAFV